MKTTHTWDTLAVGESYTFAHVLLQTAGGFGITSIHCKELAITVKPYAQYKVSLEVIYLEKGKRKRMGRNINGEHAWIMVNWPSLSAEPQSALETMGALTGGFTTQRSRYASFDKRYQTDHETQLDRAGIKPLFFLKGRTEAEIKMPTMANLIDGTGVQSVRISELEDRGYKITGYTEGQTMREELQGQPILDGWCGPIWDGDGTIRYESPHVNELLSA